MKQLSNFFEGKDLDIKSNTINYISTGELEKYKKIAAKFLSDESLYVINYLIAHNNDYVKDLGQGEKGNAVANFYKRGVPQDADKKELYKSIGVLKEKHRLQEIPVFMTEQEFHDVINKKINPDNVLLDFETEEGKTYIAKKYDNLVYAVIKSFKGVSSFNDDDLYSAGIAGLAKAIRTYGKPAMAAEKGEDYEDTVVGTTFLNYAYCCIRNHVLEEIKDLSHMVRIPRSQQKRERDERGYNTKSMSISGDQKVSSHNSKGDEHDKTVFDMTGEYDTATKNIDIHDIDSLWAEIWKKVEEHFNNSGKDEHTMDIFYAFTGCNGHEKDRIKNKELAQKYGVGQSRITYICQKVTNFMKTDPTVKRMCEEVNELLHECRNEWDRQEMSVEEPRSISDTNYIW